MQKMANALLGRIGLKVSRVKAKAARDTNPFSKVTSVPAVDLDGMSALAGTIPGMIAPRSGELLFTACYLQAERGDVVEIGSWQGRSTSYLARATEQSGNGSFYAIDHFRGNVGKENFYVVGREDLSDLKGNFTANMQRAGLESAVHLLDMPNQEAAQHLAGKSVRFLFIDGDHTREGVQRDVDLFFPLLVDGAIVAFDDYSDNFPGVIEVVNGILQKARHSRVMAYRKSLLLKLDRRWDG